MNSMYIDIFSEEKKKTKGDSGCYHISCSSFKIKLELHLESLKVRVNRKQKLSCNETLSGVILISLLSTPKLRNKIT